MNPPGGASDGSAGAAPTTVIDIVLVYDPAVPLAVTLTENLPGLEQQEFTVPEMKPVESMFNPLGRPFALKVKGPPAPAAWIVSLYGMPCVSFSNRPDVVISSAKTVKLSPWFTVSVPSLRAKPTLYVP